MYKKPGDGKKKIEKSISLELQGVNWRAITKERQTSNPKEKEEQERQMDWVTAGHKRDAAAKWTVPIMLPLLESNKSQRKTHLKAPLLSSLIPAGGLGSTKPLPKHLREVGVTKHWPIYWCGTNPVKEKLATFHIMQYGEHNMGLCRIIIGTSIEECKKTVGGAWHSKLPTLLEVSGCQRTARPLKVPGNMGTGFAFEFCTSQKTGRVLENNHEGKDGHRSSQRSWHNEADKVGGKISKSLWFLWKVFFESPWLSILLNYFSQHLRVWMRKENSLRRYINAQGLLFRRGSQIARLKHTHTHTEHNTRQTSNKREWTRENNDARRWLVVIGCTLINARLKGGNADGLWLRAKLPTVWKWNQ